MRIRLPFAAVFLGLCLIAAYAGLSTLQLGAYVNDKVLHAATFFILTVVFYWIIDTNRRRTLNLAFVVCTLGLGVGSEFLQAAIPNGREFDLYDIIANFVGSAAGLALCTWYHARMLERKRQDRYQSVPGQDVMDVELGEGAVDQEEGVATSTIRNKTLEEEVNNWDENGRDAWEEEEEEEDDDDDDDDEEDEDSSSDGKGKKPV
ncbi:polysaccharide biosynthesis protein VpsQ [Microdochium nivale]|nr:polysaccharide biosynthesis protein VpsQ [Microdochium nivale]